MSIVGNQLKNRIENDKRSLDVNQRQLGKALSASSRFKSKAELPEKDDVRQLQRIADYYKLEMPNISDKVMSFDNLLEEVSRATGIAKRRVKLTEDWWLNGDGVLLVTVKGEDTHIALFPGALYGYYYIDEVLEKKCRVKKKDVERFEKEAICFYKPLPTEPLSKKDFMKFLLGQIRLSDLLAFTAVSLLIAFASTITPIVTKLALNDIIPSGNESQLYLMFLFVLALAVGNYLLLRAVNYSLIMRIRCRLDVVLENSLYSRLLNMHVSFFAGKTAGGLSRRVEQLSRIPLLISDSLCFISSIITALFSTLPVFIVAPELLPAATIPILVIMVLLYITYRQEQRLAMKKLLNEEKNGGIVFDLISGVQRLKLSGGEDRAYAKWLRQYTEEVSAAYAVRFPLCSKMQLLRAINLLGMLWVFYLSFKHQVPASSVAAFLSAYEFAIMNLTLVANRTSGIAQLIPILELGKPILETTPLFGTGKKVVSSISGNVELSHVTFRYDESSPAVLNDLSLSIKAGEYVAIVGGSGCGKTTLVRMLLGFIMPETGTVYYDDLDIKNVDLRSLRRCIGTVLQDGKLFAGDIFSNITITAPDATMEDAWDAAEMVSMAEDIKNMPMGMHTLISEGNGGISGGQKQRLLIARAIVGKPKLMIMDEATSALDNLTQKVVTDSLDSLDCTRIVIAHRLSTIRECDRIIALKDGKIVESGSYDELIKKDGFFADLVKRQQIDVTQ